MKINMNGYNSIMFNALRAYEREDVLWNTIEEIEVETENPASGKDIAERIQSWFTPYGERMLKYCSDFTDKDTALYTLFVKFSNEVNT